MKDAPPEKRPPSNDNVPCTQDVCDEDLDLVLHQPIDALCNDALFCNGLESCDARLGCVPGDPPMVDDGVRCTEDGCDEDTDQVVHRPVDAFCDNGSMCDGVEVCDMARDCQPGIPLQNGTECNVDPRRLCIDEACAPTRCGDGFLDPQVGEECDDGNVVPGDGCDQACRIQEAGNDGDMGGRYLP